MSEYEPAFPTAMKYMAAAVKLEAQQAGDKNIVVRIDEASGDAVDHPAHYTQGNIECIDAIEAALTPEQFQGFCKGNALKYIWRAGLKGDAATDLAKARWYLERSTRS